MHGGDHQLLCGAQHKHLREDPQHHEATIAPSAQWRYVASEEQGEEICAQDERSNDRQG